MTPERAIDILGGLAPSVTVTATTQPGRFGGDWVITATLGDCSRTLTQTPSAFIAARWISTFDRLAARA